MPLNQPITQDEGHQDRHGGSVLVAVYRWLYRLLPFLVTGVMNSIVGYSTIFICLFMGASGFTANIAGYAIALICSFLLNRNYVFGLKERVSRSEVARFLSVFFVAYGVNAIVLLLVQPVFGEASAVAQVIAIAAYTMTFYPLYRIFVVGRGRARGRGQQA